MFGLVSLEDVNFMDAVAAAASAGSGFVPQWVRSTKYVKLFRTGPTSGIRTDIFPYVKASINAADDIAGTSDVSGIAAAIGANHSWVVASAGWTISTGLTIAHQPDVPRNLVVAVYNNAGGTHSTTACSWVIVGTFNGAAQTETITTPGSVSMANSKMIYMTGWKPFDSITSITPSAAVGFVGLEVRVGIGSRIGLSQALLTPVYTDVNLITQTAVPVAISLATKADQTTGVVNVVAGEESVLFSTVTANDYCIVKYATAGGPTAAAALSEHGNGETVATPTLRVMAFGV
jgi:hypothetical protein